MERLEEWFVAVPAGTWQKKGILAARELGFRVLGIDGDAQAAGLRHCDRSIVVDIRDVEAVLGAVARERIKPSGVASFASEAGMAAAAELRRAYALPGPGPEATVRLTNKVQQRKAWTERGVPGPRWRPFGSVEDGLGCVLNIGLPCVVKPADSAGSRGVCVVEAQAEALAAVEAALAFSIKKQGIVEAYVSGVEFAVETFGDGSTNHVLCVTEKHKVPGTRGTVAQELATADPLAAAVVGPAAQNALDALGYNSGPGHVEVILDGQGNPFLVEAAGRGGGFMVFDALVEAVSGYDIVRATVQQAMGAPIPPVKKLFRSASLRFVPSRPGKVISIEGLEEAQTIEGVTAGPIIEPGNQAQVPKSDGDRLAFVIAIGASSREARDRAEQATGRIRVTITR